MEITMPMPHSSKRIVPMMVSLALFMEAIDSTIINTAIPAMSASLGVNPVDLKSALISYLLSLAIFIPISGWVADKWGVKRVYMMAIALFTLSSIWCGFSESLVELVIARALQGLGGSFMLPVGRLILTRTFSRSELIMTMSHIVMIAAIGVMLGPLLGGFITHYISWHWIFWVNVPVGFVALGLFGSFLEDTPPKQVWPLDKLGFLLFGLGLSGLIFAFSAFSESSLSSGLTLSITTFSLISLFLYVLHSSKKAHPIVNPELFGFRTFRISIFGNLFARVGFGGVPFLLPLLLQIGLGLPAQISGLLLAPTALGTLLIKPFSLKILRYFGYKRLLVTNTLLVSMALCSFTLVEHSTSLYSVAFLSFLFGLLVALQYTGMNSLAYADIPEHSLSSATSVISTIQQLSQSFGVALAAWLLHFFSKATQHTALSPALFHYTFFGLALLTMLSNFIFIHLKADDGHQMTQKTPQAE